MNWRYFIISLFVLLVASSPSVAQPLGLGYYDLESLYDTIPSQFYDDSAYSPKGHFGWSAERYWRKVRGVAQSLDSLSLTIVGLYGVESEGVVRDIVAECDEDYSYIHRTRNSLDGLDFALLYFGDQLFIESVESGRNMLIVEAQRTDGNPLTIILSRSGDDTRAWLEERESTSGLVVMGRLYSSHITKLGLSNPLEERESYGEGNAFGYRGWYLHDRVALDRNQKILKSGIFIAPWLLDSTTGAPLPTFTKGSYMGGCSRYLPIFVYIF